MVGRNKLDADPDRDPERHVRTPPQIPPGWSPRAKSRAEVEALVDRLPLEPGVYLMRDRKGRVIYVGKARKLRNRVRQYFNGHDDRAFVPLLGKIVGDIETVVTANDKEALLLENNLIKQHMPRFNVKLRDDKQYIVLRLDPKAEWPRLEVVRNIRHDGASYFGPYHSASRARRTLRVVNRHFQLRTCSDHVLKTRTRACLQHQIGRCPAPCVLDVDADAYGRQVSDVGLFLGGRHDELTRSLSERMRAASSELEFETAARLRDQLNAIEISLQSQQVVASGGDDQDAFGIYREGGMVEFVLLHVRRGRLVGTRGFSLSGMELPDAEIVHSLVSAYYDTAPFVPDEVLLPVALEPDDAEPLAAHLSERRGRKVIVKAPQRGEKKKIVALATKNAGSNFVSRRNRRRDHDAALERLKQRLSLSRAPRRIECYDVSHIQGQDTVASMVVFSDGEPDKSSYRSFKVKPGKADGRWHNDDFASMYQVLTRRLRRAVREDEGWGLPDLLVIDGGRGQLRSVLAAMDDLGVPRGAEGVDVVALAKERGRLELDMSPSVAADAGAVGKAQRPAEKRRPGEAYEDAVLAEVAAEERQGAEVSDPEARQVDSTRDASSTSPNAETPASTPTGSRPPRSERVRPERVFVPGVRDPIVLAPGSTELFVLTRIRDEAHRFAITHHRKRRGRRSIESALDAIPGVGPKLKKALLAHFGTVAALRSADERALSEVPGVGPRLAATIAAHFGGP
jgi:excinuclease ABC subunit C